MIVLEKIILLLFFYLYDNNEIYKNKKFVNELKTDTNIFTNGFSS